MVREITIFEPHFHDAEFGPTLPGDEGETEDTTETTESTETSGGRSKGKVLTLAVVLGVVAFAAYKLKQSDAMTDIEIETLERSSGEEVTQTH